MHTNLGLERAAPSVLAEILVLGTYSVSEQAGQMTALSYASSVVVYLDAINQSIHN